MKMKWSALKWVVFAGLILGMSGCSASLENRDKAQLFDAAKTTDQLMTLRFQKFEQIDWNQIRELWFGKGKSNMPANKGFWQTVQTPLTNEFRSLSPLHRVQLMYVKKRDEAPDYFPAGGHGPQVEVVYMVQGGDRYARETYFLYYDKAQHQYLIDDFRYRLFATPKPFDFFTRLRYKLESPITKARRTASAAAGHGTTGTGSGHE